MEQIKVNMTPCGFTPTIHASQNDNSTRKWGFELYDENGKIDSSDIKEQMIFDSRVGGTEQILPENTSDPTTSPIIADIQYPDSLRSEQTFLYRESPTTEDGQAKITRIKGNTLVWNQLVRQSGNTQTVNGITFTNNGDGSWTVNGTASGGNPFKVVSDQFNLVSGHKYLVLGGVDGGSNNTYRMDIRFSGGVLKEFYSKNEAWTNGITASDAYILLRIQEGVTVNNIKYRPQVVDITQLGQDLSVDQFVSLFPLLYYAHTTGKLLPFKGESLKTTGKNLLDVSQAVATTGINNFVKDNDNGKISGNTTNTWGGCVITCGQVFHKGTYRISASIENAQNVNFLLTKPFSGTKSAGTWMENNSIFPYRIGDGYHSTINLSFEATEDFQIGFSVTNPVANTFIISSLQLELNTVATSFEPYTSSTINLSVLEHFPTGIKDCSQSSQVFDEKTESEAITRVGSVGLGSLDWQYSSSGERFYANYNDVPIVSGSLIANIKCSKYKAATYINIYNKIGDYEIGLHDSVHQIAVRDTSFTDVTTFKQAMADQNVELYYELITPIEEPIVTASLVTEKGEAPLYYDDGLIADCNETISSESGIFDAKIKLMTDDTIYSQKIQLHVECKP